MKITERDKMLLVVLVIVLVVALAVIMPGVGVMDTRSAMQETQTKIAELNEKINEELAALREMGITSSEAAKTVSSAVTHLNNKAQKEKVEAARLADIVMPYLKDHKVEVGWLDSVNYVGLVTSQDEEDKILGYVDVKDTDKSFDNTTGTIVIGDAEYTVNYTKRSFDYEDTEESKITYTLEFVFEDTNEQRFGDLIYYLHQAAEKGSLCVTKASYNATDKKGRVEVDILMTANDDFLLYAKQLEEEAENASQGE